MRSPGPLILGIWAGHAQAHPGPEIIPQAQIGREPSSPELDGWYLNLRGTFYQLTKFSLTLSCA